MMICPYTRRSRILHRLVGLRPVHVVDKLDKMVPDGWGGLSAQISESHWEWTRVKPPRKAVTWIRRKP